MREHSLVAIGLVAALAGTGARAQPGNALSAVSPPSPQAMPGDYFDISQSVQLTVPLGPPAGPNTRRSRPPLAPVPSPGSTLAATAAQAAVASCAADGYIVAVAVTDTAGNLKAALSPDGTRANGVYMAMHKAVTVVGFRMSTLEFRTETEKDPSMLGQVRPNMSLLPGGLPIFKAGELIGAIATSGASAFEEEKCAHDGITAIQAQLE